MTITYNIKVYEIENLTQPMWEACSIECPAMIGAKCPADIGDGSYRRCPGWSAKYTSAAAEVVHSWTLDSGQSEDCGNSVDGNGWFALFRNPDKGTFDGPMGAGVILVETCSGRVDVDRYDTSEALEEAWDTFLRETRECPYENDGCTGDDLCDECTEDEEE